MGLLTILEGTTFEQLTNVRKRREAAGIAFLHSEGNRRHGVRSDFAAFGRRAKGQALFGRRASDSAASGRRVSDRAASTLSPGQRRPLPSGN